MRVSEHLIGYLKPARGDIRMQIGNAETAAGNIGSAIAGYLQIASNARAGRDQCIDLVEGNRIGLDLKPHLAAVESLWRVLKRTGELHLLRAGGYLACGHLQCAIGVAEVYS